MKKLSPTQLRRDLFRILDEILESGEGIQIERKKGVVVLLPQRTARKLSRLHRRGTIVGSPEEIADIHWDEAWQPDSI